MDSFQKFIGKLNSVCAHSCDQSWLWEHNNVCFVSSIPSVQAGLGWRHLIHTSTALSWLTRPVFLLLTNPTNVKELWQRCLNLNADILLPLWCSYSNHKLIMYLWQLILKLSAKCELQELVSLNFHFEFILKSAHLSLWILITLLKWRLRHN